jgi:ketosteroid isomerase-like protein
MDRRFPCLLVVFPTLLLTSCAGSDRSRRDLIHDPFPEAQAELRELLATIIRDAETGNANGLRDSHLKSDKFTKFGGRKYERLDFAHTVAGETANITKGQDYKYDVSDLKIDVFGEVAIMTYYGHVTRKVDDDPVEYSWRQTLVFLDTPDGWKIIHEHQSRKEYDLAHYTFPEAQAELRAVLAEIVRDAESANVRRLRAGHLQSDKFTKFSGRSFERQTVDQCNESEAAFFTSLLDLRFEMKDLKIDVFGDVAVVTCYNHASYVLDSKPRSVIARNTLVFLKTADGWKIVHEHVTPKAWFDGAQARAAEDK